MRRRVARAEARGVTWIAGRRRWSRYGDGGTSPRRRNVRDGGREDDGVGLPRRALGAVAVPRGVLCNKRADYEPNLKLCRVIPQQIHETRDIFGSRLRDLLWDCCVVNG